MDDVDANLPAKRFKPVYIAGMFDFMGRIRLSVSQNDNQKLGYSLSVSLEFVHDDPAPIDFLDQWCLAKDITSRVVYRNNGAYSGVISLRDSIEVFLEWVSPYLLVKDEEARILKDRVLPILQRNEHLSHTGWYHLMVYVDEIRSHSPESNSAKYDAAFFREKWNDEILLNQ